jgi:hypothetical protein
MTNNKKLKVTFLARLAVLFNIQFLTSNNYLRLLIIFGLSGLE